MERWEKAMNELKKVDYITRSIHMLTSLPACLVIVLSGDDWSTVKKIWALAIWIALMIGVIFLMVRFSNANIPTFEKNPDTMILHWAICVGMCTMVLLIAGIAHFIALL